MRIFDKTIRTVRCPNERSLGLLPDPIDTRDHVVCGVSTETSADLTKYASTVKNQGGMQSCTAHAAILAYEMEHYIRDGDRWWIEGSEMHNYYNSRVYGGLFPQDGGAYLRDACKSLAKIGMCPEKLMPYNDSRPEEEPGIFCNSFAYFWKIKEYTRITSITGMKASLASKHPVLLGIPIFSNWIGLTNDTIPLPEGPSIGGHAITVIGFDDTEGLWIQNSWGRAWGNNGRAWLPYEYFKHIDWFDAWTIRL